jgi:hypothetical protein
MSFVKEPRRCSRYHPAKPADPIPPRLKAWASSDYLCKRTSIKR